MPRSGQYPQALKLESLVEKLEAWHQLGKIEMRVLAAARTVSEKCIQQGALNLQVSKQIAHSSTFDELHFQVLVCATCLVETTGILEQNPWRFFHYNGRWLYFDFKWFGYSGQEYALCSISSYQSVLIIWLIWIFLSQSNWCEFALVYHWMYAF